MVAKTCFVMTIRIFIEASWKVDQLKVYSRATSMGGLRRDRIGGMVLHTITRGIYTYGIFLDRRLGFFLLCYQLFVGY